MLTSIDDIDGCSLQAQIQNVLVNRSTVIYSNIQPSDDQG